jgi:hypothetical protein
MTHSATYAGRHRLRPPRLVLRFDVTLRNPAAEALWAILADSLPAAPEPVRALSVDAYELGGDGRAVLLHALAEHGLYAVLMPPGGEVTLAGLPLGMWTEPGEAVEIGVVLAPALTVGGAPPAFDLPLTATAGARVDASVVADQSTVVAALSGPLDIDWEGGERDALHVALG